ncbi:unnamed protein product [Cuscuta campestris]|uniref:Uncharacterized protein n=1 Tax=Cuscuta campestris TaxID=132261 RepID=A0A484N8E5_9ASTE|nr:unnamed protein product [Cuscuta campestris]
MQVQGIKELPIRFFLRQPQSRKQQKGDARRGDLHHPRSPSRPWSGRTPQHRRVACQTPLPQPLLTSERLSRSDPDAIGEDIHDDVKI